jgi:tRNA(Ile)-lysidine synthase
MRPFGMRGRRAISELLREAGVPRIRRRRLPVLESPDGILWVAGVRASERARVTDRGARALVVRFQPAG